MRPATTPRRGRPAQPQQGGGGGRKQLGKMGEVSAAHSPHRPQQLDPTHQIAMRSEHKALKRIDMAKHAGAYAQSVAAAA